MEENNICDIECAKKSDDESIEGCERELQGIAALSSDVNLSEQQNNKKSGEKRMRDSSDSTEDGFITVTRRKSQRVRRSESQENTGMVQGNLCGNQNYSMNESQEKHEVCLMSLQVLPKQMALAKLLMSENINNITRIKYKSPYKVFVQLDNREQAEILVRSTKLEHMNIRCQFTDHANLSYGIIKGVDLDMSDKEIFDVLESSIEIVSIKRLRRMNEDGKWIESETVRVCFKNVTCPDYVYAYRTRFKVDKYIFPVSQCSGCWKFGHLKKFCPVGKVMCPKCGQEHENCDTTEFNCLNCKGPHMALNKKCPFF